ncbi:MAG: HldE protein [Verrucomicrobiota bacterium]|nr:HldE protein [Verrucomicrobiota bacterium]
MVIGSTLQGAFQKLGSFRALLLGDFLLDSYTTGKVGRISPEGPVPILEVTHEESQPGGAGNVALNLASLGGKVFALGRRGEDAVGEKLLALLRQGGVSPEGLLVQPDYRTPLKNRLIARGQQLLRVDYEKIEGISATFEEKVKQLIDRFIECVDIVAISDYGKGFLSRSLLSYAISAGKRRSLPVIVDPKGNDFSKYRGVTLLKPNAAEAYAAAHASSSVPLQEVASRIIQETDATWLLITRSEEGMSLFSAQGERMDFPVRSKEVRDVTGAGDTALAMLCLGMGVKIPLSEAIGLANIAAGIAVERVGCAQVSLKEVSERLSSHC